MVEENSGTGLVRVGQSAVMFGCTKAIYTAKVFCALLEGKICRVSSGVIDSYDSSVH